MKFPKHKASMSITHNEHTTNYESIREYLDSEWFEDESEEDKQECIKAGEIWELQWYPDTPIGFYRVFAPTFEKVVEKALQIEREVDA